MRVQSNVTIFAGDTRNNVQTEKQGENSKTVYAGNLLKEFPLQDRIQQRKAQAQARALKIVGDVWGGDKKIDEELERSREYIRELRQSNRDANANLSDIAAQSEKLMEVYGIDEDSQEQKDLELLKKMNAGEKGMFTGSQEPEFTEEEMQRYGEIMQGGLTEYQERQMELDNRAWDEKKTIARNNLQIEKENAAIRGVRLERLKKDPMVKAQQEAEEVMAAARDEIISMAVEEGKEHLEEEQEKREEQAEAIEEKKEEQEEYLEERRDREDELEQLMEDVPVEEMADIDQTLAEVKRQVQNIVNKMNLVAEDIKGSAVDAAL